MSRGGRDEPTPPESARAAEIFDHFCAAGTMKHILGLHREICNTLNLKPNRLPDFYPKLKAKLANSWKAQAFFKKFDARANHKVYAMGRACPQTRVLVIGAGPCGLRAAIECQLLGAKVVVVEKRDRMSRNNVLHLWPFVIHDLRALGAKKFFGKFCAGSIDHISIRQLQCILMKVALLLGVEIFEGVSFEELLEPSAKNENDVLGWRCRVSPQDHPVSYYEFDALIGADGKRNTLQGFKRTEFRGRLALAITANFINRHTEQEAAVPEINGVSFIFHQKFFRDLNAETGIDLENIVYYKDDTHYFVMTAKKASLLFRGVLLQDYADVSRLLSPENVDRDELVRYAQEAAIYSTHGRLPLNDFALNHYGKPDVALFDFTSMFAAESASMVYERNGRRLLCQLVGDSLLEPFWPTGSGCARGFLSALDAAWAVRAWGISPTPHPLEVVAERESIYRLLAQTTPENLNRNFGAYTLDPGTRYPNLNRSAVTPHSVTSFYDSDDPLPLNSPPMAKKRRRETDVSEEVLLAWVGYSEPGLRAAVSPSSLFQLLKRYRPDLITPGTSQREVYQILQLELGIPPFSSSGNGTMRDVSDSKLRSYLSKVYHAFKGEVPHIHHDSAIYDQIKETLQKEKPIKIADHSISAYAKAAEIEKTNSSGKKKRRSLRNSQVSTESTEYICKKIGKLDFNDITKLATLIDGHDALYDKSKHFDKQNDVQEQILALFDPEESPDPVQLRESLTQLLEGTSKISVPEPSKLSNFFYGSNETKVKPTRGLKGLDANTIKTVDLSEFEDSADVDKEPSKIAKLFGVSDESKLKMSRGLKGLDANTIKKKNLSDIEDSVDTDTTIVPSDLEKTKSASLESLETANTKKIAAKFEENNKHTPSPESRSVRSGSKNSGDVALRLQRMNDIIAGKRCVTPSPERSKRDIGTGVDITERRQKVVDLIKGQHQPKQQEPVTQRRNSGEMALRMQRVMNIIDMKNEEAMRPKNAGKRKAAREITRQRFEKSLQLLAAEPRLNFAPSADLENDYGLQQYRASAPEFDERVKKLERKLQHYEEGRIVGGGGRTSGSGTRVAKLAAALSGSNTSTRSPKPTKPKDLMRSVGKIERDDWNMKEIEKKIIDNRLGRPEPRLAEKVPKWDREQFLGRQRRLKHGDGNEEKWGEIDETLHRVDQKLKDSGRPDLGTKKVANLATKFIKMDAQDMSKADERKEQVKKSWRGPSCTGMQCAVCGKRVFAAEEVVADGLHLHRACFRCAVCKAVLRPGNFTMERCGSRLVCLRHSGVNVPDLGSARGVLAAPTPERISVELSDGGAHEIDEDEWTDLNCLASETSGAGGLSDEDESSSDVYDDATDTENEVEESPEPPGNAEPPHEYLDIYFSDDSFGYDDYSDDGVVSSGNESCSRMRAAREARRREVPADKRPPTDSSEVESEEESESSDEEMSSATEVSTDSEFGCEEGPAPSPPAILVTEEMPVAPLLPAAPSAPPAIHDYPLSRARSAGGLATKRALELKRKYLLGEPSPPAVRKSDSTSQIDCKFEAFRSNITEFQKMLNPAPVCTIQPFKPIISFSLPKDKQTKPMPDIIKNLCSEAPVDLLTKGHTSLKEWRAETIKEERKESKDDVDFDSLSDDATHTGMTPKEPVPRVEVHDEGGELIQLDSLTIVSSMDENDERAPGTAMATGLIAVGAESESSESGRDVTTLALTETELSDWAAEGAVLDDCGFEDDKKRSKNPRTLSGPKLIHDAKNIAALASHVCGRVSPTEPVLYSNALDHFEFADEGDQDPSIETPITPKNQGYMELVDHDHDSSLSHDRSMNFIERQFSDTVLKPASLNASLDRKPADNTRNNIDLMSSLDTCNSMLRDLSYNTDRGNSVSTMEEPTDYTRNDMNVDLKLKSLSISEISPPLEKSDKIEESDDVSPPLASPSISNVNGSSYPMNASTPFSGSCSLRLYAPAICRSASETFNRPTSRSTDSPNSPDHTLHLSSGSVSSVSPIPNRETMERVLEIQREREEQTELVRRLVMQRLGSGPRVRRRPRCRERATGACEVPPPPRPALPAAPLIESHDSSVGVPLPAVPSLSDPDLAAARKGNKSFMKSISKYFNRRLSQRHKTHPDHPRDTHKSMGALQESPPPVPPRPLGYLSPTVTSLVPRFSESGRSCVDIGVRHSMLPPWYDEARWSRRVAQRRTARLERRLSRPLSAEQQAAAVAELVQVAAQHEAHQALMAATRKHNAANAVVGD